MNLARAGRHPASAGAQRRIGAVTGVAETARDSLEQRRWRMTRDGPEPQVLRELDDTCRN